MKKNIFSYRNWAFIIVTLMIGTTSTACSAGDEDGHRDYSIPSNLCGVSISPEHLDAFLPPGKSVSVSATHPNGGTMRCDVTIDGKIAMRQIQSWWGDGETAATVAAAYEKTDGGQVTDDLGFLYSGVGAVGKTASSCHSSDHPEQDLFAVIQVFAPERSDPGAMKKLIMAYTKTLERSEACR